MPNAVVTAPDGAKLTVPFDGAQPDPALLSAALDHYMSSKGAAPPAASLKGAQSDPAPSPVPAGSPSAQFNQDHARIAQVGAKFDQGLSTIQSGVNAVSKQVNPPMVPLAPPPGSDEAYQQQYQAINGKIHDYNQKAQTGRVSLGDVQGIKQDMNAYTQWVGANGHADDPQFKQFMQENRGRGFDLMDPPKPGQKGFLETAIGNVLPDAKATLQGLGQQALTSASGAFGLQADPSDDVASGQAAQTVQSLNPLNPAILQQPGIGPVLRGGISLLQLANGDSSSPNPNGPNVVQAVKDLGRDVQQHPVQSTLNLSPVLLHGAGMAGDAALGAVGDRMSALKGADINPTPEQLPELHPTQVGLHPTSPVGPNNTLRAPDGKLLSPAAHAPQEAPHVQTVPPPPEAPAAPAPPAAATVAEVPQVGQPLPAQPAVSDYDARVTSALGRWQKSLETMQALQAASSAAERAAKRISGAKDPDGKAAAQQAYLAANQADIDHIQGEHSQAETALSGVAHEDPDRYTQIVTALREGKPAPPAAVPETSPAPLPAPPEAAPAPAPAAKSAPAEYVGSINKGNMAGTDEENRLIEQSVIGQGLDNKPSVPNEAARAAGEALGVTPGTLRTLEPGQFPGELKASDQRSYIDAVRRLNQQAAKAASAAAKDYELSPSPENLAASIAANRDLATTTAHRDALASNAGGNLQIHQLDDDAYLAENADERMAKQKSLASVQNIGKPLETPTGPGPSPRSAGYGTRNKIVTSDAKDAALARLRSAGGRLNAGVPLDLLHDAAIVGAYHLEAGLRKFGDWSAQMDKDVPGLSMPQKQQVYAAARAEYAKGAKGFARDQGQLVLADALAGQLGRQGASNFINDVADGPHPGLLEKVLSGDPSRLTPAEKSFLNDRKRANTPARGKGASQRSLGVLNTVSKEFADANRRASLAKPRAARPRVSTDFLTNVLKRRVGKAAPAYMTRLEGDPATAGVLGKWRNGQALTPEEHQAAAAHMEDFVKDRKQPAQTDFSKHLTQIVRDAKAGKLARTPFDAKAFAREQLLKVVPEEKIPELTQDLAAVPSDANGQVDGGALNDLVSRWAERSYADNIKDAVRGGFLSSPATLGKIAGSHLLYTLAESAKRLPAKAFATAIGHGHAVQGADLGADVRALRQAASRKAIRETGQILFNGGTEGLRYRGLDTLHNPTPKDRLQPEIRLPGNSPAAKAGTAALRAGSRLHGAIYHAPITGLMDRGVAEGSAIKAQTEARAQGLSGAEARDYIKTKSQEYRTAPPPDVIDHAQAFAREQMFLNDNAFTSGLKAASTVMEGASGKNSGAAGVGKFLRAAEGYTLPFVRVPSNVAGKIYEYNVGALDATSRALYAKAMKRPLTDAEARALSNRFGRGVVGGAATAAGYALYKSHLQTAPDPKNGDYGSLNVPKSIPLIGGTKIPDSQFQPVINGPLTGAAMGRALDRGKSPLLAAAVQQTAGYAEIPTTRLAEATAAITGGNESEWKKAVGGLLASNVPAGVAFIARATDPLPYRKKTEIMDYVYAQVPGLRERLSSQKGRSPSGGPRSPAPRAPR